ncbi:hypothetical protein CB0940_01539 [Cercospora beticola]|uniref:Uncharacterized protein n=1 Tax=Cercospora beticola TaxID=122368 RepID=A0A2G5I7R0_CERBT|nr:hypothetical protein CB0940_01539 [Cercospora beticola]PIB00809.1 hypothetical protein CB0940_01539 [Cercospora beticola]WPA96981.1 hypothetical protein RHO25_001589 [Cercospora beticola]
MFGQRSRASHNKKKKATRGKLSIDTTCAVQKTVFPYESRIPELKFVSFEESHARTEAVEVGQLGGKTPVYAGAEKVVATGLQGHQPSVRSLRGDVAVATPAVQDGQGIGGLYSKRGPASRKPEPLKIDRAAADEQEAAYGLEVATPRIVITPARDEFRSSQAQQVKGRRPASSVYSRYTNCMSTSTAPPVPPLPFTGTGSAGLKSRFSAVTATTTFEDVSPLEATEKPCPLPTPGLPTPRRSKGWWTILSPFSAKSTIQSFWRSPPPIAERTPVLHDAAAMGEADPEVMESEASRARGDARYSAPCEGRTVSMSEKVPQRSLTSPAALHGTPKSFDMYFIPSTGLAAAYFDIARRFPSWYPQEDQDRSMVSPGWSPSQSVYTSPHGKDGHSSDAIDADDVKNTAQGTQDKTPPEGTLSPPAMSGAKGAIFTTPSADELRTPPVVRSTPARGMTQTTDTSFMSPLSATPEIQQAHLGMPIGPTSSFGEQKQIAVSRAPTPSALDETVLLHKEEEYIPARSPPEPKSVTRMRVTHTRQDSYGLGISDGGKNELFPPPVYVEERPQLVTDRFGQLTVRSLGDDKPRPPWYRRHIWLLSLFAGVLLLVLIILLVIFVPQKHSDVAVEASWLNLTGFPAIPIGVSTIIQPKMKKSRDTCVKGPIWSCSAPSSAATGDLPNFRLEIRSKNMTTSKLAKRSSWKDYVFASLPAPPGDDDRKYLGRTTDNVSEPYDGEETPFYISLLDAVALQPSSKLLKRSSNFSYPYPTTSASNDDDHDDPDDDKKIKIDTSAASNIPKAAVKLDGKPGDSTLYPFVTAQPLRLYNRGLDTEHYSFYTYFDRSIYIDNSESSGSSQSRNTSNNNNITTNVPLSSASAVCTFSQTRLSIKIWTRRGLLNNATISSSTNGSTVAGSSTANSMSFPGSFPYHVTVTIDRHGGLSAKDKAVYCYGIEEETEIVDSSVKSWIWEDRGVGGKLVDGGEVPGEKEEGLERRDDDAEEEENRSKESKNEGSGIDGGTGGCFCQWDSGD